MAVASSDPVLGLEDEVLDSITIQETNGVAVFFDNSNLFWEGQKASQRRLLLRTQDVRFRIDMGALAELAIANRPVFVKRLYGSEPPALDSVWQSFRGDNIRVKVRALEASSC